MREPATQRAGRPPLAVLVAVSMLQPFALNVLAPATPGLARSLQTDYGTVQLTLTVYLLTVAVTQLVVGPVSDRIGRRPCILAGVALFTLGSLIGAFAFRIETLLFARVVQAMGGGTCFALARAVVRDSASKDESASLMGYMAMAMVVSPMIAPLVGGFLDTHFGWRSIFLATVALSVLVAVAAWKTLSETAPAMAASSLKAMILAYPQLVRSRAFVAYCLTLTFTTAAFFTFVAGAPYVVVEVMGEDPTVYSLYFVLSAGGYMAGNFLSGRFGQTLGSERLVTLGIALSLGSMALEVLCFLLLPWRPATLFLPLMINAVGNGLTIPGATASVLSVRPDLAGTAAGLAGAAQLGIGALATVIIGYYVTIWPGALIVAMLSCVMLAWGAMSLAPRQRKTAED